MRRPASAGVSTGPWTSRASARSRGSTAAGAPRPSAPSAEHERRCRGAREELPPVELTHPARSYERSATHPRALSRVRRPAVARREGRWRASAREQFSQAVCAAAPRCGRTRRNERVSRSCAGIGLAYSNGVGRRHQGVEVQPAKTLWDWLQLLIVPVILIAAVTLWNKAQTARDKRAADQARQDATLRAYLGQMSGLILNRELLTADTSSEDGKAVRTLARTLTLTMLRRLDEGRKAEVVQFLYESRLLRTSNQLPRKDPRVYLNGADLRGVELDGAQLGRAHLGEANLALAFLGGANLGRRRARGRKPQARQPRERETPGRQLVERQAWRRTPCGSRPHGRQPPGRGPRGRQPRGRQPPSG